MADNQSPPVANQTISPSDSSTSVSPVQVPSPDLSDQSEVSSSADRPEPPILADEQLADEKESTDSASLNPAQTSEDHRPDSPKLADEEKVASEISVQTQSSEIIQTEVPELADKQTEATQSSQPEIEVKVEEKQIEPETASDKPQETISEKVDTDIKPPDNQASQVQSVPPDNISSNNAEQNTSSSASSNSEPLEVPKEAPLADKSVSENNSKSFGEIISDDNKPQNIEPPSEPAKPFSFGDLVKEAEDNKANIPDDLFEIKDTTQETVPQAQPAPPQPNPPPPVQQQSDSTNQTNQNPPPQVIKKVVEKIIEKPVEVIREVIKEVSVVNQEEVDKQINDRILREQTDRRNLANRVKAERVAASLDKILTFASNNSEFNNLDIRDLLHISQSTATSYLSQLVNSGRLKKEGKSKYTKYSLL